jgi:hypothetical protein
MRIRSKYWLILVMAWLPCLALTAAFILFVLGPQARRELELETKLAETQCLYNAAQEAARQEDQVRLTQTVAGLGRRVADFVVPLDTASDLAFEIAQLANQAGVESFAMKPIARQGPDTVLNEDRVVEKQIDVSFVAPFHGFMAFLNAMERHHPVLFVETFVISHPSVQSSQPLVRMQLTVLVEKPQGEPQGLTRADLPGLDGGSVELKDGVDCTPLECGDGSGHVAENTGPDRYSLCQTTYR